VRVVVSVSFCCIYGAQIGETRAPLHLLGRCEALKILLIAGQIFHKTIHKVYHYYHCQHG
jgi:hypothetical protein